nr:MAG TPA: hypothetical protein [Caudoviricetes sp.]
MLKNLLIVLCFLAHGRAGSQRKNATKQQPIKITFLSCNAMTSWCFHKFPSCGKVFISREF